MRRIALLAVAASQLLSCAGGAPEAQTPIERETPATTILRIGKSWESAVEERSFRSPPSRIAFMTSRVASRLDLSKAAAAGEATETLVFNDSIRAADRTAFECESRTAVTVKTVFADVAGEAVVEVRRPALHIPRNCNAPGVPEPTIEVPATAARFALRGDQLVPVAPPTEKRAYIPIVD